MDDYRRVCRLCHENSYKDEIGDAFCLECPIFSEQDEEGATSINQCKCMKGKYFKNNDCISCPINTYKDVTGNEPCTTCPFGYVAGEGAQRCNFLGSTLIEFGLSFLLQNFFFIVGGIILLILIGLTVALVIFIILFVKSRKKANRFDHIEGVDMILKEAELEQNQTLKTPKIAVKSSSYIIKYESIQLKKIIGNGGSSSTVYLADWNGQICAYKGFRFQATDDNTFEEFEKEVAICANVNHPHILQFYGATIIAPKIGLVLEYAENGDIPTFLGNYMKKNNDKRYPLQEKLRILTEIASGMVYLHYRNFIHRDLKPENVLIDANEKSKIMDFGISTLRQKNDQTMTSTIGTPIYMSPEVIKGTKYSNKCDVYSWSILAFVIITEDFIPFGQNSAQTIMEKVKNSASFRPKINKNDFSDCKELLTIIKRNWKHFPEERDTFKEIHDQMKKIIEN